MQSPNGWREFIGGLVDAGEVTFEANLLPRNETQNQEAGGFMAEFDKILLRLARKLAHQLPRV
jgi:hypothetical protein